ncbi:MAG: STAS/SEC14 domain-containing protein [Flavobacteriales bacterium]|nr:STAS/SEC14 domain-containing protein [Flavobacteriales bacterium]
MASPENHKDIPMARITLNGEGLVVVSIRPDVRIDVTGLSGAMHARRELIGDGRGALMFHALGDLDWEPAALQTDFFGQYQESITALAVVVDSRVLTLVANMYFGLFPARFPTKVFNDESEARAWLAANG